MAEILVYYQKERRVVVEPEDANFFVYLTWYEFGSGRSESSSRPAKKAREGGLSSFTFLLLSMLKSFMVGEGETVPTYLPCSVDIVPRIDRENGLGIGSQLDRCRYRAEDRPRKRTGDREPIGLEDREPLGSGARDRGQGTEDRGQGIVGCIMKYMYSSTRLCVCTYSTSSYIKLACSYVY